MMQYEWRWGAEFRSGDNANGVVKMNSVCVQAGLGSSGRTGNSHGQGRTQDDTNGNVATILACMLHSNACKSLDTWLTSEVGLNIIAECTVEVHLRLNVDLAQLHMIPTIYVSVCASMLRPSDFIACVAAPLPKLSPTPVPKRTTTRFTQVKRERPLRRTACICTSRKQV
jgi:hypothetical protein